MRVAAAELARLQEEMAADAREEANRAAAELASTKETLTSEIREQSDLARRNQALAANTEELLEGLAAAIRRIRGAGEAFGVLTELVESAPRFCGSAALLLRSGQRLEGFRAAGLGDCPDSEGLKELSVEIASAPAIVHAIESCDSVVVRGSQDNIPQRLSQGLGLVEEDDLTVHPIVLRNTVLAVLLVAGEAARTSAIKALILTSEAWIEALSSRSDLGDRSDG